ncbi:MAG TPA: hypothetical protein VGL55_15210 [Steroidobacteraceae bacterium]|jgi:hypothetical protein
MSRTPHAEPASLRARGLFEHRSERLIPRAEFFRRLARHALVACLIMMFSLFVGMTGYEYFEHLPWRDAFLNSAMLLGGMGPVDPLKTPAGKLFAGFYALYAGIVFIGTATVLLAPVLHRILHTFHCDEHDA